MKENKLRIEGSNHQSRKNLSLIFRIKNKLFYNKKTPKSDKYPFSIIDPFSIFLKISGYERFYLVGNNWLEKNSPKPIAMLWGFNDWKFGFVSDYLPEYRTAFSSRKFLGSNAILALGRLIERPSVFVIWGYTESIYIRQYAHLRRIPIIRVEDAFIRSAELGASHTTPYSLVFDKTGLYYDSRTRSDIEDILNKYDFKNDIELSKKAKDALQTIQYFNISKYNPPQMGNGNLAVRIKTKKRVVIIGQVDGDASLKYGNPDDWSMEELIHLAKFENPDAEIIYRPHPEVYGGLQKSRFKRKRIERFVKISSPDENMSHFLTTVDHLYVISSLSGLEALLKKVKVTVVGAPFYAGWGLTDDRAKFPRRKKTLSLLELFSGIYLKYPKYLASLDDSDIGLQAACLRITADYEVAAYELFCSQNLSERKNVQTVAMSDYWPQLFFSKNSEETLSFIDKYTNTINFENLFENNTGRIFQSTLLYTMCGLINSNRLRSNFITKVRKYIDADIFNQLLLDLSEYHPGVYVANHFSWLLEENRETDISLEFLSSQIKKEEIVKRKVNMFSNHEKQGYELTLADKDKKIISSDQVDIMLNVMEKNIANRKIDEAIRIGELLLISGYATSRLLQKTAQLAVLKFDTDSARQIAVFCQKIDIFSQNRMASRIEANNSSVTSNYSSSMKFLQTLSKLVLLKPDKTNDAIFLIKKYEKYFDVSRIEKILISMLFLDNEQSTRKVLGLIAMDKVEIARTIIEDLINLGNHSDNAHIVYSQTLSYSNKIDKALLVMESARGKKETSANYRESLRLYVIAGMYDKALHLLRNAEKKKIFVGDMHPRKVFFGNRMVKEALETFTQLPLKITTATYYKNKYYYPSNEASRGDKLITLSIFGPGDEIRFSSIYNLLRNSLKQEDISISCDPRLLSLFSRSFPSFEFIPVARPRNTDLLDMRNYTEVLGSDLAVAIDNTATEAINNSDQVMLVTDMLHVCLPNYEAFPGIPYLKSDEEKTKRYTKRLPKNIILIGLSWRSSLTTHSRNEHYLTVEELEPIFSIPGITFVNLQYDECDIELKWVHERYPYKLINLSEIDQYNDFDGVASLMKCLDLIIAPAITVVELAGALGCPTWMLSNSSELHWRKIDEYGTDVWHNSITHVEGSVLGDKASLVNMLHNKLTDYASSMQYVENVVAV